ncbi:MAG TPA: CDP-alcohol phosphatidyltransferase family protein [Solirubrobacteraceae bacterium]
MSRARLPTVAEVRAVVQPPGLLARNSGEHWAGRLYMRRVSPRLTRRLIGTPLTPNAVTWLMLLSGWLAAAALSVPGLWTAAAAVLLIQLQLLLDCSDGELARWRKVGSPAGIYLDRVAHFATESALPIGLGIRADGGWDSIGGWTALGLLIAVLVLLKMAQGPLVAVARVESGRPPLQDTADTAAPRPTGVRRLRRAVGFLPFFRAFVAVEATLLAFAAALADAAFGDLAGTRVLVIALIPIAAVTLAGRVAAIMLSGRLT